MASLFIWNGKQGLGQGRVASSDIPQFGPKPALPPKAAFSTASPTQKKEYERDTELKLAVPVTAGLKLLLQPSSSHLL